MMNLKQCQDRQQWDDFVLENGGHPLQLWGWGEVKSAHNWRAIRLFYYKNDDITGAAQVLIRHLPWPLRSLAYVPRGPVVGEGSQGELLATLADYIKSRYHCVALMIEPDIADFAVPKGWKRSTNHILPERTIILDLKKNEAELMADMAKKTRQYIRKSGAEAIEIKRVRGREDLDKCLDIYHATAKRAGFGIHKNQYYYDIFDKMSDHSPVFASFVDGQPIAFLWLAISTNTSFE